MSSIKKLFKYGFVTLICLTFFSPFSITAARDIKIKLNNKFLHFDQKPVIEKGTTLVPFRAILEELGASVEWNEKNRTITCRKKSIKVIMKIGSKEMLVNSKKVILDVEPKIINNRTLIPLRAVSQAFDAEVEWNPDTYTAEINTNETTQTDIIRSTGKKAYTASELKSIINQITENRSSLDKSSAGEFITLLNQINAFERTVKNYGNLTDTDKLAEIQSQYKIYIEKLKNFASKNGITLKN